MKKKIKTLITLTAICELHNTYTHHVKTIILKKCEKIEL